jgi:hypothetical protein
MLSAALTAGWGGNYRVSPLTCIDGNEAQPSMRGCTRPKPDADQDCDLAGWLTNNLFVVSDQTALMPSFSIYRNLRHCAVAGASYRARCRLPSRRQWANRRAIGLARADPRPGGSRTSAGSEVNVEIFALDAGRIGLGLDTAVDNELAGLDLEFPAMPSAAQQIILLAVDEVLAACRT